MGQLNNKAVINNRYSVFRITVEHGLSSFAPTATKSIQGCLISRNQYWGYPSSFHPFPCGKKASKELPSRVFTVPIWPTYERSSTECKLSLPHSMRREGLQRATLSTVRGPENGQTRGDASQLAGEQVLGVDCAASRLEGGRWGRGGGGLALIARCCRRLRGLALLIGEFLPEAVHFGL